MIVTITVNTSTYWLNSGRKYRSSCHQSGNEKGKDIKNLNINIIIYFINTL